MNSMDLNEILEQGNTMYFKNYGEHLDYYPALTKKQKKQAEKIQPIRDSSINPKIQNNDKCLCNSGKKYKHCCKSTKLKTT